MIKFKSKNRKAFSLIELLVAAAIFSMALVIAFAVFTLTLGNQSFVQANSEVNTDGDRIIRQVSDDIINANGYGSVVGIDASHSYQKIKGFIFLDTDGTVVGSGIPDASSSICYYRGQPNCDSGVNTLILFYKNPDQIKVYQWNQNNQLRLKIFPGSSINTADIILASGDNINNINVKTNFFNLTGATCTSVQCNQQPFVGIDLDVRTKQYDSKAPAKRSKFIIQTRVESRIQ